MSWMSMMCAVTRPRFAGARPPAEHHARRCVSPRRSGRMSFTATPRSMSTSAKARQARRVVTIRANTLSPYRPRGDNRKSGAGAEWRYSSFTARGRPHRPVVAVRSFEPDLRVADTPPRAGCSREARARTASITASPTTSGETEESEHTTRHGSTSSARRSRRDRAGPDAIQRRSTFSSRWARRPSGVPDELGVVHRD